MAIRHPLISIALMFAIVFSQVASAAMWCCQANASVSVMIATEHPAEPMQHHHDTTSQPDSAHQHQQEHCSFCAVSCHFGQILPSIAASHFLMSVDAAIQQKETNPLSFVPLTPLRPPIA